MNIPTVDDLLVTILEGFEDQHSRTHSDILDHVTDKFSMSEADRLELIPDSSQTVIGSRIKQANKHLSNAGYLEKVKQNRYKITDKGIGFLNGPETPLTLDDLLVQIGEKSSNGSTSTKSTQSNGHHNIVPKSSTSSPEIVSDEQLSMALRSIFASALPSQVTEQIGKADDQLTSTAEKELELTPLKEQTGESESLVEPLTQLEIIFMYLLRLVENFFQYPILYFLPVVILLVAGVVAFLIQDVDYESNGIVYVQEFTSLDAIAGPNNDGFSFESAADITRAELLELLETQSFIRLIVSETELETEMTGTQREIDKLFEEIRESYNINSLGPNQVKIEVLWEDPDISFQIAEATVRNFIEWQISAEQQDVSATRTFLENIVPEYENEYQIAVETLENYLLQNPAPIRGERPEIEALQIDRLRQAVTVSDNRYQEALNSLEAIRLEEVVIEGRARQKFSIIDSPQRPEEPNRTIVDIIIQFALFLGTGAALTVLGIVGSTLLDRSSNYPIDVRHTTQMPVLAMIPKANQPILPITQETEQEAA